MIIESPTVLLSQDLCFHTQTLVNASVNLDMICLWMQCAHQKFMIGNIGPQCDVFRCRIFKRQSLVQDN